MIYEIRLKGNEFGKCSKAEIQETGWLQYEMADGTAGLAAPRNWRSRSGKEDSNYSEALPVSYPHQSETK